MIIAVDAAGGDYAPYEIVKGAIKAARDYEVEIALVGKEKILHVLAGRHLGKLGLSIVDASQVIDFHEHPVEGVRNKPDSSIVVGTNLVRDGVASAFISAGNTGAVLYAALSILGKIKGVERPAIGTLINISVTSPVLLIDSGANADCRPDHLVQFAQLGTTYSREILGLSSPKVGLLNNGGEAGKGNHLTKETYDFLKKTSMNFVGNIEGHDLANGKANVIVTDGFTGNVVLKTLEGLGDTFLKLRQVGQVVSKAYHRQGRASLLEVGLSSLARRMDYREYGGASLLGVNGNIIIAHGRSQARTIRNAVGLAKQSIDRGICEKIKEVEYEQTSSSTGC
ncbi:MAG: phosphate acyltransferase PlsX [Chloroflexi bacterium]|nr:phosphate acyltransferase PlsX [Chloroflexota bacterium]